MTKKFEQKLSKDITDYSLWIVLDPKFVLIISSILICTVYYLARRILWKEYLLKWYKIVSVT